MNKNCAFCTHGYYFEDRSVGIFGSYECDNPLMDEDIEYDDYCSFFVPRLIDVCANCGKEINVPEFEWKLWCAAPHSQVPVCSIECQEAKNKEITRWLAYET